jgi:branched-chain amino acid aminotransferase
MVNFNGLLVSSQEQSWSNNRSFLYGDGIFETLKIVNQKVLFLEDHYFRLMASMRIVRMEIPMHFTMEYLEAQIIDTVNANQCSDSARVRITVYRNEGGYYLPETNQISFIIQATSMSNSLYSYEAISYEVDLYKDFYIAKQLLSTIKTTNKIIHVTGSIFAKENGFQNCLLLNDEKNVVEALQGNIFMLMDGKLITPPITDGCLNGILRKKILSLAKSIEYIVLVEASISPFDLQKADEIFITNVIKGIQSVTKYRKKEYNTNLAKQLTEKLNTLITVD